MTAAAAADECSTNRNEQNDEKVHKGARGPAATPDWFQKRRIGRCMHDEISTARVKWSPTYAIQRPPGGGLGLKQVRIVAEKVPDLERGLGPNFLRAKDRRDSWLRAMKCHPCHLSVCTVMGRGQ